MKCQYCNSEIPDNSSFCPNCGKSRDEQPASGDSGPVRKFCDNCGAMLEPGRSFCPNCGKPVGENTQQANPYAQAQAPYNSPYSGTAQPQPVKKKKTGLIIAVIIIVLVVLAGIGTALYFLVFNDKEEKKTDETAIVQDDTDKNEQDTPEEDSLEDDTDEDDTDADDSGSGQLVNGKFRDLEAFVNSDLMQEQLETQIASLEGTGISVDIVADGDKLVYNFTIEDENVASIMDKSVLDSSLESQAATFEGVAASLPAAVENIENPAVVVRYLDPSGAEITSMEFTPD